MVNFTKNFFFDIYKQEGLCKCVRYYFRGLKLFGGEKKFGFLIKYFIFNFEFLLRFVFKNSEYLGFNSGIEVNRESTQESINSSPHMKKTYTYSASPLRSAHFFYLCTNIENRSAHFLKASK